MSFKVRRATTQELATLCEIEISATTCFSQISDLASECQYPPLPIESLRTFTVFVAYDASSEEAETEKLPENSEIVGFVALRILDGLEFVAKIAVRQQYQKLGIGSSLIKRAEAEVLSSQKTPSLTLTTFRDVPWNGKWYAKFGFRELSREGITELGPQHVALFEKSKHAHETAGWAWIMMSKRLEM